MIKHQIFVKKHLPVQTPRNKNWQRIFDLFKLIKKDSAVINNYSSVAVIIFRITFRIKKFMNDFWNDFRRAPPDGCFYFAIDYKNEPNMK